MSYPQEAIMAILEIKKYPDPILRKKTREVEEIGGEEKRLVFDMRETLEANNGLGLSAPQVGALKRVIVVNTGKEIEAFMNPKIIKKSGWRDKEEEGCLSFPGLYLKIKRADKIKVNALDLQGNEIEIEAEGLIARVFQHEIDHLDGRLFFTRLNLWQRWKMRKKLKFFKR